MPHYQKGNDGHRRLLAQVVERYHGGLHDAGVTFDILVAFATKDEAGDPVGPALSHGGYAALATVRINPLKSRVLGQADALITLDGDRWDEYSERQQQAILDHEVTHLELATEEGETGTIVLRDDIDRPKLRMRRHDHQFGWFDDVVRRHGRNSIEWSQFDTFKSNALKQTWLPGLGPDAAIDQDVAAAASDTNSHGVDPEPEEAIEDFAKRMEASGLMETKRDIRLHRSAVDRGQLAELQKKSKKALDRMGVVAKAPGVTKTRRRKAAATG